MAQAFKDVFIAHDFSKSQNEMRLLTSAMK